ncbi:MAG: hypothetical protein FWC93_05155 [Defluviitaleaceae bacterium]|nr:hypothetical protein [Defluviitaleaceae bacterium]
MIKLAAILLLLLFLAACDTSNPKSKPLWHGFTAEEIKQNLADNTGTIAEILGADSVSFLAENVSYSGIPGQSVWALAEVTIYNNPLGPAQPSPYVSFVELLLNYQVIKGYMHHEDGPVYYEEPWVRWQVNYWNGAILSDRRCCCHRIKRLGDTGDETTNIRFYFYDLSYVTEEICTENWRDDTIRLLRQHNGYRIRHMWFDDDKLVVDLKPIEVFFFDWGSMVGIYRAQPLLRTLAGISGVEEIELLIGGSREAWDGLGGLVFQAEWYK